SKIHQLEEKLHAEEQHRKLMQEKVFQLQTCPEVNAIPVSASVENGPQKKVKKQKVQCYIASSALALNSRHGKETAASKSTFEPKISVKTGDLPFVAGKSTSTSHSLSANVQSVLHMMKHRSQSPAVAQQRSRSVGRKPCSRSLGINKTSATYTHSAGDSLTDLLLDLQGELEEMSFDHQELLKQINDMKDNDLREDLEREMDCLVKQMETKSDQILKLRRHQANTSCCRGGSQSRYTSYPRRKEIPVTPMKMGETLSRSTPTSTSKASLQLLKNVQKIQMTLKKDDIMWEK
ncbi:centrosomal protein cep57l1-like, partial [Dendropsophus ebraccatus]|uniref:centrosomal protein cep57l1-like n=1 Tax=Dendropsophus ebraccatus TaxID=150705 RepID=UPI00383190C7